jgi:hypothetical protein
MFQKAASAVIPARPATRVVLFLDVIRPLRRPADVNKALLRAIAWSPSLWDAKRRHEAWESRFERLAK